MKIQEILRFTEVELYPESAGEKDYSQNKNSFAFLCSKKKQASAGPSEGEMEGPRRNERAPEGAEEER